MKRNLGLDPLGLSMLTLIKRLYSTNYFLEALKLTPKRQCNDLCNRDKLTQPRKLLKRRKR